MGDQAETSEGSASNPAIFRAIYEEEEEEEEDEFRSCCGDENEWKEGDESGKAQEDDVFHESAAKLYFKGLSVDAVGESVCGFTGIGVIIGRSGEFSSIEVQKKLDFYVDGSVADYLALVDGLCEAVRSNVKRVLAMTDSKIIFDQILHEESVDSPLIAAFRERIYELASSLEAFSMKLIPSADVMRPLHLARVAIGVVTLEDNGNEVASVENCSICCEDRLSTMMVTLRCSHKFCSHCMRTYVDGKVQTGRVPLRCPQLNCRYLISTSDCKTFLPLFSYDSFKRAMSAFDALSSENFYCPFPNCSTLLDPSKTTSSGQSDSSCIECPVCKKFICVDCGVPWHTSFSCEEYQSLPFDERDGSDITSQRLIGDRRWRSCQQCRRVVELTEGSYHMTCWCGHEFCYSCGAGYREGHQNCECASWDDISSGNLATLPARSQETEQWPWDSVDSFPAMMDAYSDQERSQLALIQRFLAGGFGLSDHHHHQYQSWPPHCTDSYVDAMKDLHQLPWLERFVSVISDTYYDQYIH